MAIGRFRGFRRIFTAFFGLLFGVEALPINVCGAVDIHTLIAASEQPQQPQQPQPPPTPGVFLRSAFLCQPRENSSGRHERTRRSRQEAAGAAAALVAKHERQTVAMALAEALHHSAPRGHKSARTGVRPGVLEDPDEQHAAQRGPKPPSPGVPSLAMPVLAGTAGEGS